MICCIGDEKVIPVVVVAQHAPCTHSLLAAVVTLAGDVAEPPLAPLSIAPNPCTSSADTMNMPCPVPPDVVIEISNAEWEEAVRT
jgi:hypothetical protein